MKAEQEEEEEEKGEVVMLYPLAFAGRFRSYPRFHPAHEAGRGTASMSSESDVDADRSASVTSCASASVPILGEVGLKLRLLNSFAAGYQICALTEQSTTHRKSSCESLADVGQLQSSTSTLRLQQ